MGDIRLSIKGRVYPAAARSELLNSIETWLLRPDMHRILVFENWCLRFVGGI